MLCIARSIRVEPAASEVFRRDQGTPHGHGKGQEAILIAVPFSGVQLAQDKFLQKPVEVYLEQAQVPAGSNRRAKVVVEF